MSLEITPRRKRSAGRGMVQLNIRIPRAVDIELDQLKGRIGLSKRELVAILLRYALAECVFTTEEVPHGEKT